MLQPRHAATSSAVARAARTARLASTTADPYLHARAEAEVIDIPPTSYIAVEGRGRPHGAAFQHAIRSLFATAYAVHASLKRSGRGDTRVSPLEGLWWSDRGDEELLDLPRSHWRWQLRIRVPSTVTLRDLADARVHVGEQRDDSVAGSILLERVPRQRAVQVLHVGPYEGELASIEKLRACMTERALAPVGTHCEIYLGDPRRTKPERLKTILRRQVEPVARAAGRGEH